MGTKKPKAYQGNDLEELYQKIANRAPFQFDLENNALYRQYRDEYQRLGTQAMTDTMGRAANLTGGYGSTYSQTAGQQAYGAYLQELNRQVPALYSEARNQYDRETERLQALYNLEAGKEAAAYNRWQDEYNRWLQEYRLEQEQAQRAQQQANWEREQAWQQANREQAQANWQAEQDFQREKWEYQKWLAAQKEAGGSSGGSGRGSGSSGSGGSGKGSGSSGQGEESQSGPAPGTVYNGGFTEQDLQRMADSYLKSGRERDSRELEQWLRSMGLTSTAAQRFREILNSRT